MRKLTYTILQQEEETTLERYLMRKQGYSRRLIRMLKKDEFSVMRNHAPVRMVDRLILGDKLEIILKEKESCEKEIQTALPAVPVLYEDDDLILYHKPPFLAVHSCRDHQEYTLASVFARDMCSRGITLPFRPVYRLDRDTEGIVVCAKNMLSAAKLSGQIQKRYLAVCIGAPKQMEGRIDQPIAQLVPHRMERGVHPNGQRAVTNYRLLGVFGPYSLVEVHLETGRTHQIRVHFSHNGFPVAGDSMYGKVTEEFSHQALFCEQVSFFHPTANTNLEICINMQDKLENLLQNV